MFQGLEAASAPLRHRDCSGRGSDGRMCAQVRGATAHFDAVVSAATSGVLSAGLDAGIPVIFCVMTTDTMEQVAPMLAESNLLYAKLPSQRGRLVHADRQ